MVTMIRELNEEKLKTVYLHVILEATFINPFHDKFRNEKRKKKVNVLLKDIHQYIRVYTCIINMLNVLLLIALLHNPFTLFMIIY